MASGKRRETALMRFLLSPWNSSQVGLSGRQAVLGRGLIGKQRLFVKFG